MVATREIHFLNEKDVVKFLFEVNNVSDDFCIQIYDDFGTRVSAKSLPGMAAIATSLDKKMTIYNVTHNGLFPSWLNKYFVLQD